jgi:hypothetical protein
VLRAVVVPYVLSRGIVIATLGLTREVIRHLDTVSTPIAVRQGLRAWDGGFYTAIAHGGYDAVPHDALRFFPLYPLLARAVAWLPGIDVDASIVIVANACAFALGFVVYHLVWFERGDERLARRAVWFLFLVPPAYVLVMAYSEATFMLLATIVLYASRRSHWWIAAAAGVLAGLTRPIGLLLMVPVLVEAVQNRRNLVARDIVARGAAVLAPFVGCFIYLSWAANRTSQFFEPLRTQEDPTRRGPLRFPVTNVIDVARDFASGDHDTAGLHLVSVTVCLVLLVVLARRWPLSYTLYAAAALGLELTARNLDSLERYMLSTVPFVFALADLADTDARERVVLVLAVAGLVAASALAFTGALIP